MITLDNGVEKAHTITDVAVFDIELDELSALFDKAQQGYTGYKVNISLFGENKKGYVSNLEADDNINLAGGTLDRTWSADDKNVLNISDGTSFIAVTDYFGGETAYPVITLNEDDLPTTLDVTLDDTTNRSGETDTRHRSL